MEPKYEFIDGDRYYVIDGGRYIGVTSVFNILPVHGLAQWQKKVGKAKAKQVLDDASARGTKIHKICERIALGEKTAEDYKNHMYCKAALWFERWLNDFVADVIGAEEMVYHKNMRVAGQLDFILRMKGDEIYTIGDIKTGKIKPIARMQTAAYRNLALDCTSIKPEQLLRRLIIPVTADQSKAIKIKEFPVADLDYDWKAYCGLANYWRWNKNIGRPK